jgi:hypothetical protein
MSANAAFSDRKPYPGWIASAPVIAAADRIEGMFRHVHRLGVRGGVHRDGRKSQFPAGALDAKGDLATIGN